MESHDLITRGTVPLSLALQSFQTLINCESVELGIAIDWVKEATITLSLSDCAADLARFAEKRGTKVSQPESVLKALFSLEGLRASINWKGANLVEFLEGEAKKKQLIPAEADTSKIIVLLIRFFEASAKLERTLKAQRIYDGLLPNYEACYSLVEFRPVFDEAREEIVNGIIAANLTIEMRAEEFSAEPKKISVQLDAADIDQLLGELTRLKRKIKLLRELAERNTVLLNPSRSINVSNE